jgi:hypothetical protein
LDVEALNVATGFWSLSYTLNHVRLHIGLEGKGIDSLDDRKMCVDDSHIGIAIVEFPVIWLQPVLDVTLDVSKNFHCPMYKTSVR